MSHLLCFTCQEMLFHFSVHSENSNEVVRKWTLRDMQEEDERKSLKSFNEFCGEFFQGMWKVIDGFSKKNLFRHQMSEFQVASSALASRSRYELNEIKSSRTC